jgi:hypothetical protein
MFTPPGEAVRLILGWQDLPPAARNAAEGNAGHQRPAEPCPTPA